MQNKVVEPDNQQDRTDAFVKQVFKPSSWLSKIEYINHLILFNNVMITVVAEQGAGKTTFTEVLQTGLDASINSVVIKAAANFSKFELLAQLNTFFGPLNPCEHDLANLVKEINERKTHVLVIIDDAHHLTDSFLQEVLGELEQQGDKGFFKICLMADFSLVARLNQLDNSLIYQVELGGLSEIETKTYLINSLASHKKLNNSFSDKRLTQFYQLTAGDISRINKQKTDYFCIKPVNNRSWLRSMSFVATAAVALIGSSYIWKNQFLPSSINSPNSSELFDQYADVQQPLPSLIPIVPHIVKEPLLISRLPDINHELASQPSKIPIWFAGAIIQKSQPSPKRVVDVALEEEENDSLVLRDRVLFIPKSLSGNEHIREDKQQRLSQENNLVKSQKRSSSSKPTVVKAKKMSGSSLKSRPLKPVKITQKQFTIQLIASRKQEDLLRFLTSHKLKAGTKIRLTKRGGLDWYVLTLGEFGQLTQAPSGKKQFAC